MYAVCTICLAKQPGLCMLCGCQQQHALYLVAFCCDWECGKLNAQLVALSLIECLLQQQHDISQVKLAQSEEAVKQHKQLQHAFEKERQALTSSKAQHDGVVKELEELQSAHNNLKNSFWGGLADWQRDGVCSNCPAVHAELSAIPALLYVCILQYFLPVSVEERCACCCACCSCCSHNWTDRLRVADCILLCG